MLLEINFDLIFKELSVQDTLKYPSHHLKHLVLKKKVFSMAKTYLAKSFYVVWWFHLVIFTRCYATKFYAYMNMAPILEVEEEEESWWRIDPNQGWRHMLKKTKHV